MSKPGILFNELIDQYKLEKHLAQKRVTDFYLALDVDENKKVAIEILLPNLANQQRYANRFVSKLQTVSRLNHPHIAKVFQVGSAPNKRPYFAREHVEGIPLSKRLADLARQEHPVNSIYALKLVRQVADALALAERLDIFHYDLHPDNIILQPDGKVMLIDLGIPRIKQVDERAFLGGVTFDTRYWSIEQLQNKPLDAKSHVYTLGVILFELLTGHVITLNMSSRGRFAFLSGGSTLEKLRPDLSFETVRLVQKALRATLSGRFGNSADLMMALDEAIQAEELVLHSGTAVRRPQSTSRLALLVGLPLLLVLVIGIGFILARNSREPVLESTTGPPAVAVIAETDTPPPTETPFTPEATATVETAAAASVPLQLLSPAQDEVVSSDEPIVFRWRWDASLDETEAFLLIAFRDDGTPVVLERVTTPIAGNSYEVVVPTGRVATESGMVQWQVVLTSTSTGEALAESELRPFAVLLPTQTPTHTVVPTVTPTHTPSPTATPLPQVVVVVSSASLRTGPSPRFPILRFLENGDVVTVLAIVEDGTWWNVVADDGTAGWLTTLATENVGDFELTAVPTPATIPPEPTATWTPTPTQTFTPAPTETPGSSGGDGGGAPPPPPEPPTKTPPPP